MNFPWVRHSQRYEYIINKGYIYNKIIADVGCGDLPSGAYAMADHAKLVFAIDPLANRLTTSDKVVVVKEDLFDFRGQVEVITAVEVFEHIPNPEDLIAHLSKLGEYLFITTPLAEYTRPTRNARHVAEYSSDDFDSIIGKGFYILNKVYQLGDLQIVKEAESQGDSLDTGHVVQMAWCRSRYGK